MSEETAQFMNIANDALRKANEALMKIERLEHPQVEFDKLPYVSIGADSIKPGNDNLKMKDPKTFVNELSKANQHYELLNNAVRALNIVYYEVQTLVENIDQDHNEIIVEKPALSSEGSQIIITGPAIKLAKK